MTKPPLLAHVTYVKRLLFICLVYTFSPVSHASTKDLSITDSTTSQLIGVMYTSQQMQLETVKEQQRLELERLRDKLSEMDSRIDNFQSDLDSQKQAVESGKQENTALSKRLDDSLVYSAQSLDRFGVGITIILAVVGFVGYFSFSEKTKREAKNVSEQWFNNNALDLQKKIRALEAELTNASNQMSEHVGLVEKTAEEAKVEIQRLGALVATEKQVSNIDSSPAIQKRADFLKDIPSSSYTYDDWNSLAYASYTNEKLEEAAIYWLRASEVNGASDVEISTALYNRGVAQSQLNQLGIAIETYGEVLHRFGDATDILLKELVAKSLVNKGFLHGQRAQPDTAVATFEEVVDRFGDAAEIVLKEQIAKALVNKGVVQGQSSQLDVAVATYEEVVHQFGGENEPVFQESVAKALVNKGIAQGQMLQSEEALVTFDEVIHRFAGATDLVLKEAVAKALVNKGFIQGQGLQPDAAVATYDEVVCRFEGGTELVLRELVAKALVGKALMLIQLNKQEAAVETCDEVIQRFDDATDLVLKESVARALVSKGFLLGQGSQPDAAINCYEEVIQRFGLATEVVLQGQVVNALINKGVLLGKGPMSDAAIGTYQEVVQRFGDTQEPAMKAQVAHAYNSIGFDQLCKGKSDLMEDDNVAAKDKFSKALDYFDTALSYLEPKEFNGYILGNRAYSLALLGKIKDAESAFAIALRAPLDGGKKLHEATISDLDINPVPQDEQFRALIEAQLADWLSEERVHSEDVS